MIIDGPISRDSFPTYVEKVLSPRFVAARRRTNIGRQSQKPLPANPLDQR